MRVYKEKPVPSNYKRITMAIDPGEDAEIIASIEKTIGAPGVDSIKHIAEAGEVTFWRNTCEMVDGRDAQERAVKEDSTSMSSRSLKPSDFSAAAFGY